MTDKIKYLRGKRVFACDLHRIGWYWNRKRHQYRMYFESPKGHRIHITRHFCRTLLQLGYSSRLTKRRREMILATAPEWVRVYRDSTYTGWEVFQDDLVAWLYRFALAVDAEAARKVRLADCIKRH